MTEKSILANEEYSKVKKWFKLIGKALIFLLILLSPYIFSYLNFKLRFPHDEWKTEMVLGGLIFGAPSFIIYFTIIYNVFDDILKFLKYKNPLFHSSVVYLLSCLIGVSFFYTSSSFLFFIFLMLCSLIYIAFLTLIRIPQFLKNRNKSVSENTFFLNDKSTKNKGCLRSNLKIIIFLLITWGAIIIPDLYYRSEKLKTENLHKSYNGYCSGFPDGGRACSFDEYVINAHEMDSLDRGFGHAIYLMMTPFFVFIFVIIRFFVSQVVKLLNYKNAFIHSVIVYAPFLILIVDGYVGRSPDIFLGYFKYTLIWFLIYTAILVLIRFPYLLKKFRKD